MAQQPLSGRSGLLFLRPPPPGRMATVAGPTDALDSDTGGHPLLKSSVRSEPCPLPKRLAWLCCALCLTSSQLAAQLERPDPPTGAVRVGIGASFANMDSRFLDGTTQALVPAGSDPTVVRSDVDVNIGVGTFHLGWGVTSGISLYGTVPLVRYRLRSLVTRLDPTNNVAQEIRSSGYLTGIGDVVVGASFRLVDSWDRGGRLGGARALVFAEASLPTGDPHNPYDLFEAGTGSGQNDYTAGAILDLGAGNLGLRLAGSYTRRMSATVTRRIGSPIEPLSFTSAPSAEVRWTPGDRFRIEAQPMWRWAAPFAVSLRVAYDRSSGDTYQWAGTAIPGLDVTMLEQGTESSFWIFGGGVTYSSPSIADPRARPGLPVEAFWRYQGVVASDMGVVFKAKTVVMGLRIYGRLY